MKYFAAVVLVWLGCALAWVVLGATLVHRSGETSGELTTEVDKLWGPPLSQSPPTASYQQPERVRDKTVTVDAQGRSVEQWVEREVMKTLTLPLVGSDLHADLRLQHRQKGLLWFATYGVDFGGRYEFVNDTALPRQVEARFPLEASGAVFDGFRINGADGAPRPYQVVENVARFSTQLQPGEKLVFHVQYRARGRGSFHYAATQGTGRVERFVMKMSADFADVDFPSGTLSPSTHTSSPGAWRGEWRFDSLVASAGIGVELPQKLNPGPLASRITFFAPVGLLFFLFVAAVLGAARGTRLHPMHYLFIGCAFFAFHLLFAYTVDLLAIELAFAAASAVSVFLVVSYGRLFLGLRAAALLLGVPQLLYLVLFSATFFWQGYTGLAVTVGAVLTLFVIMQLTGRTRWDEAFRSKAAGWVAGSA
jgi:Inner membrane protein CreD